ncbi:hypothetical protein ACSBR2_028830 [Camellia fascicularis]
MDSEGNPYGLQTNDIILTILSSQVALLGAMSKAFAAYRGNARRSSLPTNFAANLLHFNNSSISPRIACHGGNTFNDFVLLAHFERLILANLPSTCLVYYVRNRKHDIFVVIIASIHARLAEYTYFDSCCHIPFPEALNLKRYDLNINKFGPSVCTTTSSGWVEQLNFAMNIAQSISMIQVVYELLRDVEKRRQYDIDNRVNPMKASQAWMEWLMKKRKAFDQRSDMAIAAWTE